MAAEPYAEIEIGIDDWSNGIRIIAKGIADANGNFRVTMPPMSTGFLLGTNRLLLFAKAPGKDRSSPIYYTPCFLVVLSR